MGCGIGCRIGGGCRLGLAPLIGRSLGSWLRWFGRRLDLL